MRFILHCGILRLFYVSLLFVQGGRHLRSGVLSPELHSPKWLGIKFKPTAKWYGHMHVQFHGPHQIPVPADGPSSNASSNNHKTEQSVLQRARGVFVLLHSCSHHSTDFFTLPEETTITTAAIRRGFVALVPDAPSRTGGCWSPHEDGLLLYTAINMFLEEKGLKDKPIYGVGISSGGVMLARLVSSYKMPFLGCHFIVSPGAGNAWKAHPTPGAFATHHFPRTSFVYMENDLYAPPKAIHVAAEALRKRGTEVLVLESPPKPVRMLMRRAGLMNIQTEMMRLIIQKLYNWGYLESRCKDCQAGEARSFDDTLWLQSGYSDGVARHLFDHPKLGLYLKEDMVRVRALNEELHYIEAVHGPTADHIEVVMEFLVRGERP